MQTAAWIDEKFHTMYNSSWNYNQYISWLNVSWLNHKNGNLLFETSTLPVSHISPVNPEVQLQRNSSGSTEKQVALFSQGLESHGLISAE